MKYLKTYENLYKFNVDDYVKIIHDHYKDEIYKIIKQSIAAIKKYNIYYISNIDRDHTFWENEGNLKKVTDEELKDYYLKKDTNKYNL